MGDVALAQLFRLACDTPSDVNEHLPTLHFGRAGVPSHHGGGGHARGRLYYMALLYAQPDVLVCYGETKYPEVEQPGTARRPDIVYVSAAGGAAGRRRGNGPAFLGFLA